MKNILGFQLKKIFKTIPNLTMDGTAIKTIARSNPFVLVLENGKIVEKKSLEDFLINYNKNFFAKNFLRKK
jgi:ABC-type methionine transport system ATPase subunit